MLKHSGNWMLEVSSSYLEKFGIMDFLPKERSRMRVCFFFPRGNFIDSVVLEYR